MTSTEMRWHVRYAPEYMAYTLHLTARTGREVLIGEPMVTTMTAVQPGEIAKPTMILEPAVAQQLFDELWKAGLRPNSGESGIAHVDAMRAHLADMRALVFPELEPKK